MALNPDAWDPELNLRGLSPGPPAQFLGREEAREINPEDEKPGTERYFVLPPEDSPDFNEYRMERCSETTDYGNGLVVQCSRDDGHEGWHFADGNNPFGIACRWRHIPINEFAERESLEG
jgi:hypothetical protein